MEKIISKIHDTGLISIIEYISKGLNIRYLNRLHAGILFAHIPKPLFLYFMISIFFFLFSLDKDSSFPLFPVTFHIVTGFVRLHQSHVITLCHVKKQWKIRYFSTFRSLPQFLCKYSLSLFLRIETKICRVVKIWRKPMTDNLSNTCSL